jgi:cation/acetate symporter
VGIIAIGSRNYFQRHERELTWSGWAFSIAASANFPSIIMMLFWKKTTAKGITASVLTGMVSALTIILLSESMFDRYGIGKELAPIKGLENPAIISIPLAFIALIVVSLVTQKDNEKLGLDKK